MAQESVWKTLGPITQAACMTSAIMYPVDVLRALKMASATGTKQSTTAMIKGFVHTHGVVGLFKQGVAPEMARATWMRVSKFFLFPIIHESVWSRPPSEGSPATKAVAGALATIPEAITITPMEMSKIGLQMDHEKRFNNSMNAVIKHVYRTRGVMGLFTGIAGIQYRQASWTAVYFGSLSSFEHLVDDGIRKITHSEKQTSGQKKTSQLISGFLAGVAGSIFNTPGDVIRTSVQRHGISANLHDNQIHKVSPKFLVDDVKEFFVTGRHIFHTRGLSGLYYGFLFKAFHLGGSGALLALLVPYCKALWGVHRE